jgi:DNA polymerase-1
MIVRRKDFESIVSRLSQAGMYGLDTETTGLRRKDRLFSIILADEQDGYYFNFNDRPDHRGFKPAEEWILPRSFLPHLQRIFSNHESTFGIHNAKFDMGMLAKEGLEIHGSVHCTEALARVIKNNHMRYSLADCAARIGLAKDAAVEEYIRKNKLTSKRPIPGKDRPEELWHFELVPFEIMAKYGINDAILHRKLMLHQVEQFADMDAKAPVNAPSIMPLVRNEQALTRVCFEMEQRGIRINRSYAQGALSYTQQVATSAMKSFEELTGHPYDNSATTFVAAFKKIGIELPKTPTGKPCTKAEVLEGLDNPVSRKIVEIRTQQKLVSTYYSNFLYFADEMDILRANMRQGGTETGRFSYSDPNLQNVPKEDEPEDLEKPYLVRSCFIPREGHCFVMIDYEQQEYKLMAGYAGEQELVEAILSGKDVHQATADLMGVTRKAAKAINFGLLYGQGAALLAKSLGVTIEEAYRLKRLYFSKLPKIQRFIRSVQDTVQARGYIWNWLGRRCHLADSQYAYIIPNHLIQGGGADVVKRAMVELSVFLADKDTKMLVQVHDEILFEVPTHELHLVPELKRIMENVYPKRNGLGLTCSVEHSWKSWGSRDKVKGFPNANAA